MTRDERELLAVLLRRRRTKAQRWALMEARDRRIERLAVYDPEPLLPKLVVVVRTELTALGVGGTDEQKRRLRGLVDAYGLRLAKDLLASTRGAVDAAQAQNRRMALADSLLRASGNVVQLVAMQTGAEVQWITERDSRVCEVCAPRDGVVYAAEDAPELPAHPRCRCGLVAVFAGMAA